MWGQRVENPAAIVPVKRPPKMIANCASALPQTQTGAQKALRRVGAERH